VFPKHKYFGEHLDPAKCQKKCDNCQSTNKFTMRDITDDARQIVGLGACSLILIRSASTTKEKANYLVNAQSEQSKVIVSR
jgi:hypothetical protein